MTSHELLLLNIANAALGIATLIACVMIGWATVSELAARVRARVTALADDHAFDMAGLGVTMADGGEKVDEPADEEKTS